MANEEHLAILRKGVEEWNRWREESLVELLLRTHDLSGADLSGANLSLANLDAANLSGANLRGANLSGANLISADLFHADLSGADLSHANFSQAYLSGADLSDSDLSSAILFRTNLFTANLCGSDLSGTKCGHTLFAQCDLRNVEGLENVRHLLPSTIGLDTIYQSQGQIPEAFLLGCGVPQSFITQMRALVGAEEGIQFYSCFISYSGKDEEFARRLHEKMRAANLRVWFAPEDMKRGEKVFEQIETAIRVYDKLLIVLSEESIRSDWVMTELHNAFAAERRDGRRKLFPVRLTDFEKLSAWKCPDPVTRKDLADEVRQYFIPDFSHWKTDHDQFEAEFAKLLRDLKADARPAAL